MGSAGAKGRRRNGTIEAGDHLGLVHAAVQRTLHIGPEHQDYDDCFSQGCEGLVKAIDKFDADLGYRFSTFAYRPIRWGVIHAWQGAERGRRLNTNIDWDSHSGIHGSSASEPTVRIAPQEQREHLFRAMATLPEKQQDILQRSFGLGGQPKESYESIGHSYGVTKERIRQIRLKALTALRYSDTLKSLDV